MKYNKHINASRGKRLHVGQSPLTLRSIYRQAIRFGLSLKSTAFGVLRGTQQIFVDFWPVVLVSVLVWGTLEVFDFLLDRPVVQTSHSTQKCVRVINPNGAIGTCDQLPSRYYHEWVE